jgi:hypothetical protein
MPTTASSHLLARIVISISTAQKGLPFFCRHSMSGSIPNGGSNARGSLIVPARTNTKRVVEAPVRILLVIWWKAVAAGGPRQYGSATFLDCCSTIELTEN